MEKDTVILSLERYDSMIDTIKDVENLAAELYIKNKKCKKLESERDLLMDFIFGLAVKDFVILFRKSEYLLGEYIINGYEEVTRWSDGFKEITQKYSEYISFEDLEECAKKSVRKFRE